MSGSCHEVHVPDKAPLQFRASSQNDLSPHEDA
jgi:hypothetical protein